jgi:DNA invertase Pin-like site-specific DNA recombinase
MGHLLGYARVSTTDQDASLQIDALNAAGCYRVFVDTMSGSLQHRLELDKLLDQLRPGDTLVVRSIRHLIDQLHALAERGIGFRSLQETIDTTSPGGRLVFHVFAALAEFERDLIKERTNAGLAAARARGRTGGRPSRLSADQVRTARRLYEQQDLTVAQIGDVLGVSRTTIYRALARHTEPVAARRPKTSPTM